MASSAENTVESSSKSKQTIYPPHKITPSPPEPFIVPPQSYPIHVAKLTQNYSFDKTRDGDIVKENTCQQITMKRKDPNEDDDQDGYYSEDSFGNKFPRRICWTREMASQFNAAVDQLGLHKDDADGILALMKGVKVARGHVASHLERYKLRMKGRSNNNYCQDAKRVLYSKGSGFGGCDTTPGSCS